MKFVMLIFRKGNQVFRRIVRRVAINMVNVFTYQQAAAIVFFPNKAMFGNISALVGKMMLWHKDEPVTRFVLLAASLPSKGSLTTGW